MTAIVGLVAGPHVYLGGDSASSDGWAIRTVTAPKVIRNGPYLIGYTTSFRMGQLLEHTLQPPTPPADATQLHAFMCTDFITAVRDTLRDGGWAKKDAEQERGGEFLAGVAGHLYTIHADHSVIAHRCGYSAVGSGYLAALGSLHTTAATSWGARRRLTAALEAAADHAAGVRGPFTILRGSSSRSG